MTFTNDAPATFPIGTTPVTWTATDPSGNSSSCTTNVTVTPFVEPCPAIGGTLSAPANRSFCVGTGVSKSISVTVTGAAGANQAFALTNNATGAVVAARPTNSNFNLDIYPPGDYTIRYIRYEDGVAVDGITNIAQAASLEGCYSLASNNIVVFLRSMPDGGTLSALSPTTVCANAGAQTAIQVGLSGLNAENYRFGLVSVDQGNLVVASNQGTPTGHTFNLIGRPTGSYAVAAIGFQTGVNIAGVQFASQLQGCYDLSNPVLVNIVACLAAELESAPNPTPGTSFVSFTNPREEYATLEVYDMSGRMVERIFNQVTEAGQQYRREFNGDRLPNGVYLYRLTTDSEVIIEKFIIAK